MRRRAVWKLFQIAAAGCLPFLAWVAMAEYDASTSGWMMTRVGRKPAKGHHRLDGAPGCRSLLEAWAFVVRPLYAFGTFDRQAQAEEVLEHAVEALAHGCVAALAELCQQPIPADGYR